MPEKKAGFKFKNAHKYEGSSDIFAPFFFKSRDGLDGPMGAKAATKKGKAVTNKVRKAVKKKFKGISLFRMPAHR